MGKRREAEMEIILGLRRGLMWAKSPKSIGFHLFLKLFYKPARAMNGKRRTMQYKTEGI